MFEEFLAWIMARVLYITHRFWPYMGGAERLFFELARRTAALGHSVTDLPVSLWGTVLSGVLFVGVELHQSFVWLFQLKGLAVGVKALLLVGAAMAPRSALAMLVLAIVIGGISSHMPGKYRYYSIWHGRVIKE